MMNGNLNQKEFFSPNINNMMQCFICIVGMMSLLNLMLINGTPFRDEYLDDRRETPFHVITKYKHTSDIDLMIRVANVLIEKKFTASMKDMDGHLAIDYISEDRQKPLYDVLVKITWSKLYSSIFLAPRDQRSI